MRSKLILLLGISHGAELLIWRTYRRFGPDCRGGHAARTGRHLRCRRNHNCFLHQLEEVDQIAERVRIIDRGAAVLGPIGLSQGSVSTELGLPNLFTNAVSAARRV